jgi:hypothetical protein
MRPDNQLIDADYNNDYDFDAMGHIAIFQRRNLDLNATVERILQR